MRHVASLSRVRTAMQAGVAVGAGYGSAGLVLQLDGFDMPTSWLRPLPLSSWLLPGLALLLLIAFPMAAAAFAGWRKHPRARLLSWSAVTLLLGWMALQLLVMGLRAPVQVVTLAVAALLLLVTARAAEPGR